MIRLAVDAEGGDFGADVVVRGVIAARCASSVPFVTRLCGDGARLERVLGELWRDGPGFDKSEFIIEHCPDVITADDRRAMAWKDKAASSIVRCVALQREGQADASVSAGDTGILIGSALFILGRAEGVSRPALAAFIPTPVKPVLVMDVGANISCRAEHLAGFVELGCAYVSRLFGHSVVRAGLLNVGTEPAKGPDEVREAARLLEGNKNYSGFIEGNRVFSGEADVVVCDGFVGNVLLKTSESFYSLITGFLADSREIFEILSGKMDVLNPENYGAAPLLGINGTVLKAHGGSSVRSIKSAVLTALKAVVK